MRLRPSGLRSLIRDVMNQRTVLVLILVGAVAFAAYQAVQLVRPVAEPAVETPAPLQDPPPESAAHRPAGTMPYDGLAIAREPVGLEVPFDPSVARRVTVNEVKALMDDGKKVILVDTRAGVEGTIVAGAVVVPEAEIEAWARTVPSTSTIVVYCACAREATAEREVLALQKLGFRRAYALLDGLLAWEAAGLPTEQARRQ